MPNRTKTAAFWSTAIVLLHFLATAVHAAAHANLRVDLNPAGTAFVVVAIVLSPLLAAALVWTSRRRAGLYLLAFSMTAALLFGLYHHFLVPGPDHVGSQGMGFWAAAFAVSAYGLFLLEAAGAYAGIHFLYLGK